MLELAEYTNHTEETVTTGARVDPARNVFITSTGEEIELSKQPITSLMLERVVGGGKPKPPHIEVTLLGKHKEIQENRNDPNYLKAVEEWEAERNMRSIRYIFVVGTKGQPPEDFATEQRAFFPDATDMDIKYLWIASRIPDTDIDKFTECVLGRAMATEKGLQDAANFTA